MIYHPIKILLVEDNPGDVLLLQETLADLTSIELDWVPVERLTMAIDRLAGEDFDVILLDLVLPDSRGLDTLLQIQARAPRTPIVVLTGMTDENMALQAVQAGAQDYLVKGQASGSDLLVRSIRYAIERKRIEATLQQRERQFRTLTENAPDVIARFDRQLRHLYVNSAVVEVTGFSVGDFLGKSNREMGMAVDRVERWEEILRQVFSTGLPISTEFEFLTPTGVRYFQSRCVPEFAIDGSVESVLTISRDLSDLKQAERKIREQAALIDISPDAIVVCDLDNRILVWNQGAAQIYGWTAAEILGTDAGLLFRQQPSPQLATALQAVLESGRWQGEANKIAKNGGEIWVSSRWKLLRNEADEPYAILTIDRDITAQKQLETQLLRTQRLESLGTLAGGIAHDLNNVLTPILAAAQLLPLKLPDLSEQDRRLLKILEDSSKRGAHMVKQILTFARGLEGELVPLELGELLMELGETIQSTLPKSIEIDLQLPKADLWLVSANATHLYQVFLNFCVNARDAMPNGGKLRICAENRLIDETYAQMNLDAKVGAYVVVTFADTGTGIAPAHIDRIFEPFFTTKPLGEGTGLGLSTAMGIIRNHGGFVTVSSEIGRGTEFQVFLPVIATTTALPVAIPELPSGRGELILIVDDESNIRQMLKITLESYNYQTISASNGVEAIAAYAIDRDRIAVVVLDLMMPLMDGTTAIRALQQLNVGRQMKIIACSGLVPSHSLRQMPEVKAFLSKPFTAEDLLNTVHRVIWQP
ncbi:hybrid sensor histidine kinase/response regulator [Chamaesiphon polymorphus]|uniref:histidine kinase n=1 Tax=Chamaesiphon polymorphus CCALA 037 TaxID=2107692 RepID=A0A2T1GMH5_9CYAN|nr:response regulator [Chamaesiphon polymorphus]PSB59097.1 hybrid sensor histidine kinase/response regulator [Chamaesiphon polymorphus CCALA 037]